MSATIKTLSLWLVVIVVAIVVWNVLNQNPAQDQEIDFSRHLQDVRGGRVASVTIYTPGNRVEGLFTDGTAFNTTAPDYDAYLDALDEAGVAIKMVNSEQSAYLTALISWAPMLILIAVWIFFMRQMQSGGNRALAFGKSRARLTSSQDKKVTFKDVAGIDEAKEEVQEIIEFLREPQRFQRLGGRIPKGVLLIGPPGTGKTLLARAIAGEANVPFFSISGSDFVEMFVGVGASRVRDLFEQGKKNAPCIIFIDEIDAVGRHRGAGLGGGHDEREQTLNQLLVEMDGFGSNEGVILMAATNRPDVLDPALLRPGRFDRRIVVDRPDVRGRLGILRIHTRSTPLDEDVDLQRVARGTPGFCGADLENLVNEAALLAARRDHTRVTMQDFEDAKDKVLMGAERKSLIISDEEKRVTAYHEAGHALVAYFMPDADPLHKVTIIPRGRALGVTQQLPLDDRRNYTRTYLETQVTVLLGGRIAEELVMNEMTTGAGNDLERVTDIARRMVTEWGMSKQLGPLTFGAKGDEVFLGRDFVQHKDYSDDTALLIDGAIKKIVDNAYNKAHEILSEHQDALHAVANALLTRETLDGEEISMLAQGKDLPEVKLPADEPQDSGSTGVEAEPAADEPARDAARIPSLDEGHPAKG
ncbi:MAG: ATP-dependent zinc metalloprotease FtsH [Acidobacteriota bacterium]|jgi:cell division protease FtsH